MQRLSWLCCGGYSRAAVIWACLAVVSPLVFFLLEWFRPQDDPYTKATYEEQRYLSDVEIKRLCAELKVSVRLAPARGYLSGRPSSHKPELTAF
jgi:hypothetical protein